MNQPTFAEELADRFISNEKYWALYGKLQSNGVIQTLHQKPSGTPIASEEVAKLLYCAEVFVQTDNESLHRQAQEIAIHTLLVSKEHEVDAHPRERALALLTELGNFPGLNYVERSLGVGVPSLLSLINRRVSEKLNTVRFGDEELALTAYQKRVWNGLAGSKTSVITAPTSAGKSFLVVEHLCRLVEESTSFLAVYVTPTRALLSEVHQKIQARLKETTELRISAIPTLDKVGHALKQVFVLTQERLSTLLAVGGTDLVFDLVVVDEAQNIGDDSRGMILQDCLERIAERSSKTRVILLAPGAVGMPEVIRTFGISDIVSMSTQLSPVQQNRLVLSKVFKKPKELRIAVMGRNGARQELGSIQLADSLNNAKSRLALVAIELGGEGGSLLYETGPREAEKAAEHLVEILKSRGVKPSGGRLEELSKFIKEHVHPDYQLAAMVRYGVAYHYGRMPSLLRDAIETSFKMEGGGIRYLVCTTTLAQGVNLPARNVFIDTPKYGVGKPLDPALLWNFAGRAGRLNKDVVGNVFLLDYEKWTTKPMDTFVPFNVKSATATALATLGSQISDALKSGNLPRPSKSDATINRIRSAAGLMVAHAARNDVKSYLSRVMADAPDDETEKIATAASSAYREIGLPAEILIENWTIDPFGLRRLRDEIMEKIGHGRVNEIIPVNPNDAKSGSYEALFGRIVEKVNGDKFEFGALAGRLAVDWMKGIPYPEMLARWIARQRVSESRAADKARSEGNEPRTPQTVDALIRKAFDLIEDVVRFQFVQLGKAYRDILLHALRSTGNKELVPAVFDFALALELGVSSQAGTAYVELGLSRIAASALERLSQSDTPLTAEAARKLISELDVKEAKLSPVIVTELLRLGLVDGSSLTEH